MGNGRTPDQIKMSEYYHSFDDEMKSRFGGKVYRLSLSAAKTCPNRDGHCGTGGCIFCSAGGSGDFAEAADTDIYSQIERAKERVKHKLSRNFAGYMAYFQSFTETYGDQHHLESCFRRAAEHPDILALSIATRPDSIEDHMLSVLADINRHKPVYVELGLQTIHEDTAEYINRGYKLPVFEECFRRLKAAGLRVVVHVIIGLPGEDAERTRETVRYLAELKTDMNIHEQGRSCEGSGHIDGIKLQLLHVLKGTRLAELMPEDFISDKCTVTLRDTQTMAADRKETKSDTSAPDIDGRENLKDSQFKADTRSDNPAEIILNDGKILSCYNIDDYARLITELVRMLPPDITVHRITGDAPKRLLIYPAWSADKKRVLNAINRTFRETALCNEARPR